MGSGPQAGTYRDRASAAAPELKAAPVLLLGEQGRLFLATWSPFEKLMVIINTVAEKVQCA